MAPASALSASAGPPAPSTGAAASLGAAVGSAAAGSAPLSSAPSPLAEPPLPPVAELLVPLDRRAWVLPGAAGTSHVMVYLHGRCGNPRAFERFARAAHEQGVLVALKGDKKCDSRWDTKWSDDIGGLARRIEGALRAAERALSLPLTRWPVTLVGYSQGALRAEQLARHQPKRFRRVVLIAGPTAPTPGALAGAFRVAVVVGSRDARKHLQEGVEELDEAHIPVRYLELPGVGHGEYGPDADRVLREALTFVHEDPFPPPPSPLAARVWPP